MSKLSNFPSLELKIAGVTALGLVGVLGIAQSAIAHHPMGSTTPDNFLAGFLSGLGHPIVGLDHFAFVVASGLLAATVAGGLFIPIAFVVATMVGTGIHLAEIDIPGVEILIATSVIAFGTFVAINHRESNLSFSILLTVLGAVAGIFHGYAYGEAIIGARMDALFAYLIGFALIQLLIAGASWAMGKWIATQTNRLPFPPLRFIGIAIGAIGAVFLASAFAA